MKDNSYYKVIKNGLSVQYKDYYSSTPKDLTIGSVIFSSEAKKETKVYDGMPVTEVNDDVYISLFPYVNGNVNNSCWTHGNHITDDYLEEISEIEAKNIIDTNWNKERKRKYG